MRAERILAPNPGLFTGPGTNTWVVAVGGEAVVIDPGPTIPSHQEKTLAALDGLRPLAILVTHNHPDHAPAANGLARELKVPTVARQDGAGFVAERRIDDGDRIGIGDTAIEVVATPGHTADHACFHLGEAMFTGDHIMGGSTVIVEDMTAYLLSLHRLLGIGLSTLYPGHGEVMPDAEARITEYIEHRLERERQISEAVASGARTVGEVVEAVYRDVDRAFHPAAAISVTAHLRRLAGEGAVEFEAEETSWEAAVEPVS